MTQESEFIRLEETVNNLLKRYSVLKAAKEALEVRVQEQNQEIDELRSNIQNMQSERGDVSDRVSNLLDQIEQWEQDLGEEAGQPQDVEQPQEEAAGTVDSETETVMDADEPYEGDELDEEDSAESRQGNLFSVDSNGAS